MVDIRLFEKTEIYIKNIQLSHVNLNQVAEAAAKALKLPREDVAVVDVRSESIVLDILRETVSLEQIVGKKKALLTALCSVEGVTVNEETEVHSEGQLGLVNLSESYDTDFPTRVESLNQQIKAAVRFRAIVFPSGTEIIEEKIEDTNTPFLLDLLTSLGYQVTRGKVLEDSFDQVIGSLSGAVEMGYGLVVTTGGVGAEDKDHIVEAILALDPKAAAPYIVRYTPGQGRHKKDGIRIAVGSFDLTTFIALPGPNDEVRLVAPTLARGLREQWDGIVFAEKLVQPLRTKLAPPHSS